MAGNGRFHDKYHKYNHHTLSSVGFPDSASDPIASPEHPFKGDFILNGSLSASGGVTFLSANITQDLITKNIYNSGNLTTNYISGYDSEAVFSDSIMSGNGQNTITFRYISGAYFDSNLNVTGTLSSSKNIISPNITVLQSVSSQYASLSSNFQAAYTNVQAYSGNNYWNAGKNLIDNGGTIAGPVKISNSLVVNFLSALSGSSFVNTTFATTSTLSVVGTLNSGPALFVGANGAGDIASFYDLDQSVEILHIGGHNSTYPNVGIKVSSPTKTLTVSGEISASGGIWGGNIYSNNQNLTSIFANKNISDSTTSTVSSLSSTWNSSYSLLTGGINSGTLNAPAGYYISTSLSATMISANTIIGTNGVFYNSLSAPNISGVFYGDGKYLTGVSNANGQAAYSLLTGGTSFGNLTATSGYYITTSLSATVISANTISATNGVFFNSLSAPNISGVFYGDGSKLTGVSNANGQAAYSLLTGGSSIGALNASSGYVITTSLSSTVLSANVLNVIDATIFNSLSAPSISGVFYGDGSNLTGVSNANGQAAYSLLTGGINSGTLNASSGYYISTSLSARMISAARISATTGTFYKSISAPMISGVFYGDGSKLGGFSDGSSAYSLLISGIDAGVLNAINGYYITTSLSATMISANTISAMDVIIYDSLSAPMISGIHYGELYGKGYGTFNGTFTGVHYGDGSNLSGIVIPNGQMAYSLLTGGSLVGNLSAPVGYYITTSLSATTISANTISATNGVFYNSLSAPNVSGVFYGDGSRLTGIVIPNGQMAYSLLTGGSLVGNLSAPVGYYITTSLSATVISANTISGTNGIFYNSLSAPNISGVFYGDGTKLNINPNGQTAYSLLTGGGNLTAASGYYITTSLSATVISANTISGTNGVFYNSLSAPNISGVFYGDGSRLNVNPNGQAAYTLLTAGSISGNLTAPAGYYITTSLSATVISANTISGTNGVFYNSLSAPNISGVFYGDGSKLSGIVTSTGQMAYSLLTGGSSVGVLSASSGYVITTSLSSSVLSANVLNAINATIFNSLSAPIINGSFYGDGKNLTNIITINGGTINGGDLIVSSSKNIITDFLKSNGAGIPLRINSDIVISGQLTALSGATFANTNFTTTSSLCIQSVLNSGPAVLVAANGSGAIASFFDTNTNIEMLHVGGANSAQPNIGIKVSNPTKTLTISGEISALGDAWFGNNVYAGGNNIGQSFTTVSTNSSFWAAAYRQLSSGNLSAYNTGFSVNISLSSPSISAITGFFSNSVSALMVSGIHYGDGSRLTGIFTSTGQAAYSLLTGGSLNGNFTAPVGYYITTSLSATVISANTISATNGMFYNSVSALMVSGIHYGDGSRLTGIGSSIAGQAAYSLLTAGSISGNLTAPAGYYITTSLSSTVISAITISATNGVFYNSLSAPNISGIHYGDGSKLTGLGGSVTGQIAYSLLTGGSLNGNLTAPVGYYITTSLSATVISANTISATNGVFYNSLSAPNISGVHYGDGSRLNINPNGQIAYSLLTGGSLNGNLTALSGYYITTALSARMLSAITISATDGTFFNSLSAPSISANILISNQTRILTLNSISLSTQTITGFSGIFYTSLSTTSIIGASATFTTNVSAPNISANIIVSSRIKTDTLTATSISTQTITSNTGTYTSYLSTPIVSAANIYGIVFTPVTTKLSSFTLSYSDINSIIRAAPSVSTNTMYIGIPTNASVPFPVGIQMMVAQVSAGTVSVSAAAGVTVLSYLNKLNINAQNSVVSLVKTGQDEWLFSGDIN